MAVVAVNSNLVANIVASPPVQNPSTFEGGRVRSIRAVASVANGDSIASVYRMARIMSHWRLVRILLTTTAITSAAANLGLYRTVADGGAVVSAALYASATSLASAINASPSDLRWSAITTPATSRVYEDLALTANPNLAYDLAFTLTAAAAANGTVGLEVLYTAD